MQQPSKLFWILMIKPQEMEKLAVILILFWACQAKGVAFPSTDFLLIDCGVIGKSSTEYNYSVWYPDSRFIDSGKTKQINSSNDNSVPPFLTTLRYFPKGDLNCYPLKLSNQWKYIFRAGFYYANYDGKSQPPVFDLLLAGQLWETVNSSSSSSNEPIFHELIYTPKNGNITVCLRSRKEDNGGAGAPFISSLEATYMGDENMCFDNQPVYSKMENGMAYHLLSRINYGGYDQVVGPMTNMQEEILNRYWMPQHMLGYTNITFDYSPFSEVSYENCAPDPVISTAIASQNTSQSIHLSIALPNSNPQSTYMVLYFYQNLNASQVTNFTRYMDVSVDGVMKANVKLESYRDGEVVTLYPLLVQDVVNVTVSSANGTVLPPVLNAMEVFIANELHEESSIGSKVSSSFVIVCVFHFFVALFIVVG